MLNNDESLVHVTHSVVNFPFIAVNYDPSPVVCR